MFILPTLSRPKQCYDVLKRIDVTKTWSRGRVFVNGSSHAHEYYAELEGGMPRNWHVIYNEENIGALGALNKVFEMFPEENFYAFAGDDELLSGDSPNDWDRRLIDAAGDWNFSHGDDSIHHGERAQGYLCIGGKLARAVGYLAIPECWHAYGLDDMWEALARTGVCKKVFVPEVKIEHRHPMTGMERDACYELGESRHEIDEQIYYHWLRTEMGNVVERIEKAKNG